MSAIEIVGGAILLAASVVIIVLTLMQHTHGQGLSGAINGGAYGANNPHHAGGHRRPISSATASRRGKGDPHRRCRLLRGGRPGLCVRQPSGLRTRAQPRVRRGCFSV